MTPAASVQTWAERETNMSTIHQIAADIAARVPEMARDSAVNNAELIEGLLRPLVSTEPKPVNAEYWIEENARGYRCIRSLARDKCLEFGDRAICEYMLLKLVSGDCQWADFFESNFTPCAQ